jgi:YegS/Rv2252/BmrU family lipid kinase
MKNNKICFILNPVSGMFSLRRRYIEWEIKRLLRKNSITGDIRYSKYRGHTTKLAAEAVAQQYNRVVVAGGDGSIHEAASALVHSDIALGIIPAGSGNGLARHLHLPFSVSKALKIALYEESQSIDALNINGYYAFSIIGAGFDARVAQHYRMLPYRGLMSYLYCVVTDYFQYKPIPVKIQADGKTIQQTCLFVLLANSNQFGYNFRVAPQASLYDGLMDVVIVPKMSLPVAIYTLLYIWAGRAHTLKNLTMFRSASLQIESAATEVLNIDGDPYPADNVLHVKVIPNAINIVMDSKKIPYFCRL